MDQASFISHHLTYDATLRNIELIGEAATHIPDAIRAENSDIPWRMIVDEIPALLSGLRIISANTIP